MRYALAGPYSLDFKPVNPRSRAGKNGKLLLCPHCKGLSRVYHFSWSALSCQTCGKSINKYDWEVGHK